MEFKIKSQQDKLNDKINELRIIRNFLLSETDWWASSDLSMSQEQIDYRQALRDITNDFDINVELIWPIKPKGKVNGN